ncbi:MAG: hypothetical protein ACLRZO_13475 [Eggerthella lenta]
MIGQRACLVRALRPGRSRCRARARGDSRHAWIVQYLLMRAYGHPDAFPATDLAVRAAFPELKPRELARASESWSPWRSYAVMSLWSTPHGRPDETPNT